MDEEVKESFIDILKKELLEAKIAKNRIDPIISKLKVLNDNYPFNNLAYLKDMDTIKERLSLYKLSAQREMVKAITIVMKINDDKKFYSGYYKDYVKLMYRISRDLNKQKMDKQKEKLNKGPKWQDILDKRKEMVIPKKVKNEDDYIKLLEYFVISLYTDMLPRKNQDYQKMVINRNEKIDHPEGLDDEVNHLLVEDQKMIFNIYSGSKLNGQQEVKVSDEFMKVLKLYLRYHPTYKPNKKDVPLIVDYQGKHIKTINYITKILNKTFGKGISACMLQKMFIKHKFGDQVPLELLLMGFIPKS